MAQVSKLGWLGLLVLAGSASAATVGPIKGRPVTGRPLEVNIPFAVDEPTGRACASANVRYGNVPVPRPTLQVQGQGARRNLLVSSRARVSGPTVSVQVRVGCGARAVTRMFVMPTNMPAARGRPMPEPVVRQAVAERPARPRPAPVALLAPAEPLFPPPAAEAVPQEIVPPKADATLLEDLRRAREEAAGATARLEATRKELAAVLDIERRTSQTLIDADHEIREARSEAAHMRLVLNWVGAGLALGAAGLAWLEFQRVALRRRTARPSPEQEPAMLSGAESPA